MKRLRLFVVALLFAGAAASSGKAEEVRQGSISKAAIFLPLDFYERHRASLNLNAEQASALDRLAESIETAAQKLEGERAKRLKAVMEAMAESPIDSDEAMARFQALLEAENQAKTLQFRAGIEVRSTLTPEQLHLVEELAERDGAMRLSSGAPNLKERIQQLRAELLKPSAGTPDPATLSRLKEIEQMARQGRAGEAKIQLDELLKRLRQNSAPPAAANLPNPANKSSR